ncbi:MAG TPA: hypothetical protein VI541_06150 [Actinomycetota bacterium]|nr:hypothetical protein [Actinomycetota bacterium]
MSHDDDVLATLAAAVDTILPGSSGAGVQALVADLFDGVMEGFPMMVSAILDAFASEISGGHPFAQLSAQQRGEVFETMMSDPSPDVNDVVDGLFLFTLGQNYSEAHPDHDAIWERLGYHGPSEGIVDA